MSKMNWKKAAISAALAMSLLVLEMPAGEVYGAEITAFEGETTTEQEQMSDLEIFAQPEVTPTPALTPTPEVMPTPVPQGKLKISEDSIDFGKAYLHYENPPSRTIKVENTGNAPITLEYEKNEQLNFTPFTKTTLWPGDTAEITVNPVTGLAPGTYYWTTEFRGISNGQVVDTRNLYTGFWVYGNYFAGFTEPEKEILCRHGVKKTPKGLRLPDTWTASFGDGDQAILKKVPVVWNLNFCTYLPELETAQSFQVEGTLEIPPEQNTKNLSTKVTAKVQVMAYAPLAAPVIKTGEGKGNHLIAELSGPIDDADGYDYVLVKKAEDLETETFVRHVTTTGTKAKMEYVPKGEYLLFVRAYQKKEKTRTAYSPWSEGKAVAVGVETPRTPAVRKAEVKKCDVKLSLKTVSKADGYEAVLARKVTKGVPSGIIQKKNVSKAGTKTVLFTGLKKGTVYPVIRSYLTQNGTKVYSPWSAGQKLEIQKTTVSAAPTVTKCTLSRGTLKADIRLPKGTDGADWVLAEDYYTYRKQQKRYYQPIDYVQIQKIKTGSSITFQNLKPGTYYLFGHAYVKGFQKNMTDWSTGRKIVVK